MPRINVLSIEQDKKSKSFIHKRMHILSFSNLIIIVLKTKPAVQADASSLGFLPWVVKLKSDGFSLPLGSLTLGSRSSSKKVCAQASRGVRRAVGVYSSRREHKAMASGGVRGRKTCDKWRIRGAG